MKRDNRRLVQLYGLVVLSLVLPAMVGCGASQRQTALTGAYALAVASDAALLKYDQQHARDIIVAAPDKATGESQLTAWRLTVSKIETDVAKAINSIAAGFALNNDPTLKTALDAVAAVQQELAALGIKVP